MLSVDDRRRLVWARDAMHAAALNAQLDAQHDLDFYNAAVHRAERARLEFLELVAALRARASRDEIAHALDLPRAAIDELLERLALDQQRQIADRHLLEELLAWFLRTLHARDDD